MPQSIFDNPPSQPGTPWWNPYQRRGRIGRTTFAGMPNPFGQRIAQQGYGWNSQESDRNLAFGDLLGLTELNETDEDIKSAWDQFMASGSDWAPSKRAFLKNAFPTILAEYRLARAMDPNLRFAHFLGGLDTDRMYREAERIEANRTNPFFRGRFVG